MNARTRTYLLRSVGALLALLFLWIAFRDVEAAAVGRVLGKLGPVVLLAFLPQIVALAVESWGWRWAFQVLGKHIPYVPLFKVRVATEALTLTMPGGVLVGEGLKPYLLKRDCGVEPPMAIAAIAARKYLLIASQGLVLLGVVLLGQSILATASVPLMRSHALPWISIALGLGLITVAAMLGGTLQHGAVARRIFAALRAIPIDRVRGFLDRREQSFESTDAEVAGYFSLPFTRRNAPILAYAVVWLIEVVETYLILRLLGVELGFMSIACIEVVVVLLRHVFFLMPAGLGAQDLGYVAFLTALGVPEAPTVGAAFAVLKRSKEVFWAGVGYALLVTRPSWKQEQEVLGSQELERESTGAAAGGRSS